jgi:hypothetical protein
VEAEAMTSTGAAAASEDDEPPAATAPVHPIGRRQGDEAPERRPGDGDHRARLLVDLVESYRTPGRPHFRRDRLDFEQEHGRIVEYYFSTKVPAGAVLVRRHRRRLWAWTTRYCVMSYYDGSTAPAPLDEALRTVRREERQSAVLLQGRARQIFVQTAYSLIVYLLNALDCTDAGSDPTHVDVTVASTRRELAGMQQFTHAAARRTALWYYLMGLPLGAVTGIGIVTAVHHSKTIGALTDETVFATCLAGGAIGAVISVMVRVTRGTTLDVDFNRGRAVTLLAGSFRPVIGAVFGGVLFVLVLGGLLPLQVPPVGALQVPVDQRTSYFFIGLSFLAGFSERWAQDTIVNSAPKIPSTRRSEPPDDGEDSL